MNLNEIHLSKFHCTCSDDSFWSSRIQKRVDKPTAPNQSFKSVEAALNHYSQSNIYTLDDEIELDSIYETDDLITQLKI